jgi:hypothetical protein
MQHTIKLSNNSTANAFLYIYRITSSFTLQITVGLGRVYSHAWLARFIINNSFKILHTAIFWICFVLLVNDLPVTLSPSTTPVFPYEPKILLTCDHLQLFFGGSNSSRICHRHQCCRFISFPATSSWCSYAASPLCHRVCHLCWYFSTMLSLLLSNRYKPSYFLKQDSVID